MQLKVKLAKICYNFLLRIEAGGAESGLSGNFILYIEGFVSAILVAGVAFIAATSTSDFYNCNDDVLLVVFQIFYMYFFLENFALQWFNI